MTENTRPIVTAVGRRLRSKHGEPRLDVRMKLPRGIVAVGSVQNRVLDPGSGEGPIPWPLSAGNPRAEEVCLSET